MPVGDILVQYSVTPCVFYALCVIMTDVHQGQRCKQLERRVLLAEKRTVVQRRAERRMGGQTVFFIFALLRLQTLFLPLCAPVLKPDLYLSLGQAHGWGDGVSLQHRQVVALLKALLQNLQLLQGECGTDPTAFFFRALKLRSTQSSGHRAVVFTWGAIVQLSGFISGSMTSWKRTINYYFTCEYIITFKVKFSGLREFYSHPELLCLHYVFFSL